MHKKMQISNLLILRSQSLCLISISSGKFEFYEYKMQSVISWLHHDFIIIILTCRYQSSVVMLL